LVDEVSLDERTKWLNEELPKVQNAKVKITTEKIHPKVSKILSEGRIALANFRDKDSKEYNEILQYWPLLPQPMITSKLFATFTSNDGIAPAVLSCFDLLKFALLFEKECEKLSKAKDRHDISKKAKNIASIILQRIFWTFSDLINVAGNDKKELFAIENFYNCLNLIRVYEFTALDLLGVPKKQQEHFATPEIELFPDHTVHLSPILIKSLQDGTSIVLKDKLQRFPSKELQDKIASQASVLDFQGWTTSIAIDITLWWSKSMLKAEVKWRCGNWKTCENEEQAFGAFKKCSSCNWVRYCSRECQIAHWKEEHKVRCGKELDRSTFSKQRLTIRAEDNN